MLLLIEDAQELRNRGRSPHLLRFTKSCTLWITHTRKGFSMGCPFLCSFSARWNGKSIDLGIRESTSYSLNGHSQVLFKALKHRLPHLHGRDNSFLFRVQEITFVGKLAQCLAPRRCLFLLPIWTPPRLHLLICLQSGSSQVPVLFGDTLINETFLRKLSLVQTNSQKTSSKSCEAELSGYISMTEPPKDTAICPRPVEEGAMLAQQNDQVF